MTAVKTEADRALAAIQTLAVQTATNAENLRNALTSTAQTIAKQTSDTVSQLIERIAALEKSSYEGVGKQRVSDPQTEELVREVRSLRELQAQSAGKGQGVGNVWAAALGIALLASVAFSAYSAFKPAPPTVQMTSPQR